MPVIWTPVFTAQIILFQVLKNQEKQQEMKLPMKTKNRFMF